MSSGNKILDKLSKKLGDSSSISDSELDQALENPTEVKSNVEFALDEHLNKIAAAHTSNHGDHHASLIN